MSIRNFRQNVTAPRVLVANATYLNNQWVRNPSWLPLASVVTADQKFSGLYQINQAANFVALNFSTSSGTYHVDWGDGTSSDTASGSASYHEYNWSDVALDNTNSPVTFQDSGDTVTRTAHGYVNGMTISFANIVTTTGITAGQIYYVISASANTFQLSATVGGAAIALTTDGTGTILPYKQAVVTVTCNTGGATITTCNLQVLHNQSGLNTTYCSGWLDITLASNATSISIGGSSPGMRLLQQANILKSNTSSFSSMFSNCTSLVSVITLNSSTAVTNFNSMFSYCASLTTVPLFNTASATSLSNVFSNCYSLTSVPLFNTALVTDMSNLFNSCYSLDSVPLFNTASVTSMASMFAACYSLTSVPLFNTASVVNMDSMFSNCYSLESVPLFNTALVTAMSNMFFSCGALKLVPLFNTVSVTGMSATFRSCSSLITIPLLNTSAVTDMTNMFASCTSLQTIPLLNTANVTTMGTMFNGCFRLQSVPALNTIKVGSMTNMFLSCSALESIPALNAVVCTILPAMTTVPSMSRCEMVGMRVTFSCAGAKLSGTQLDNVYTNLTATGGNVTFTDSTDLVTMTTHGFVEGQTVSFSTITTTTGISTATTYYARNPTANTFQLSSTISGSIINLVNDGTGVITAVARTITVTNNYGTTSDTPTIATAKGWTVTGS